MKAYLTKQDLYKIPLLQNIWYAAREVIHSADEIYIVGYSFPSSDFTAEFLFRQALASSFPHSSIPNKKINIVNIEINDEYKKRIERIFQKCEVNFFKEDVVHFLEYYLKKSVN